MFAISGRSFEMRKLLWLICASGTILTMAPTHAQTFDPRYPVCLQLATIGGGLEWRCEYSSLAQCAASASGRAGSCMINPYFAQVSGRPFQRQRPYPY
jgi:hypothetical protein